MFAATTSVALVGVEPRPVRAEVHLGGGKPRFSLVGLPDTAVREAKERVSAAVVNSGFTFPGGRVIVNLAPADIPKAGSAYDLPIALGVIAATKAISREAVARTVALGELALDGSIRPARGGLGAGMVASRLGLTCLVPPEMAPQAARVADADVRVVRSLAEAVSVTLGETPGSSPGPMPQPTAVVPDLADVRGQAVARRALEVAAAGGHHLLMSGPPGAGKTMLARAFPSILPPLGGDEALEVAQVWSAAGLDFSGTARPFRSPHHSATVPAIVGGGSGVPGPGEISLAHRGVLFLDELGEFPAQVLDSLRQPLEAGSVTVARRAATVTFPSAFQLIAATNPCPCGFGGDFDRSCRCTPRQIDRYRLRLSGPLVDRIDLAIDVHPVGASELTGPPGEASADVLARVVEARERQAERGAINGSLGRDRLDRMAFDDSAHALLERAISAMRLTGRGWDRVRRVARTIADLAGDDTIGEEAVAEALGLRSTW